MVQAYIEQVDTRKNSASLTFVSPEEQQMDAEIAAKGLQAESKQRKRVIGATSNSLLGAAMLRAGLSAPSKEEKESGTTELPDAVPAAAAEADTPITEQTLDFADTEANPVTEVLCYSGVPASLMFFCKIQIPQDQQLCSRA